LYLDHQIVSKCRIKAVPINSITKICSLRSCGVGHLIPSAFSLHSNIDREKENKNSLGVNVIGLFYIGKI
jgi:hypothetical protein